MRLGAVYYLTMVKGYISWSACRNRATPELAVFPLIAIAVRM